MGRQEIGLVGMGVMGTNLALNIESKGYPVAVYSWKSEETERFMAAKGGGRNIAAAYTMEEFAAALRPPRRILIMVTAGAPVDNMIDQLKPYLSPGDILIDGGNSFFMDTIRRNKALEREGLRFIGTGISGGEEGALKGPSIMPGGQPDAYAQVEKILTAIAAKVDGEPCCTYIGADGAGHYVKMVHNGIEYSDMQLICEAYHLMKNLLGMGADELRDTFAEWNRGELDSYLIEITRDIFGNIDAETGKPLVEMILDTAGQKGTGKWTSQSALDLGVPAPTIAEAVFARCLSAIKEERVAAGKILAGPQGAAFTGDKKAFVEDIRKALYASKICSYAQGFSLMRAAATEYGWRLDYGRIAMIWRGGCIIRARFLHKIKEAFDRDPALANLLLDPYFKDIIQGYQGAWREVVAAAVRAGLPVPAFASALAYYDGYRSGSLPANLLQAQRDYFGAHTFARLDKPGVFHHEWQRAE